MTYGYIRVSTDKQDTANQRYQIENFCKVHGIVVDEWVEETISSTKALDKRLLGGLLDRMVKGDMMIACELSRLGRNLMQIMSILNGLLLKDVQVWTIKDNYRLGNDIQSKVLAFAFGLSAEIERNLISQRTKEALARRKSEGVVLGRPIGRRSDTCKLDGKENEIRNYLSCGLGYSAIGRLLKCHRLTVSDFCLKNGLAGKKSLTPAQVASHFGKEKNTDIDLHSVLPLYKNGKTMKLIAAELGLSQTSLVQKLRKAGLYNEIESANRENRILNPSKKYNLKETTDAA